MTLSFALGRSRAMRALSRATLTTAEMIDLSPSWRWHQDGNEAPDCCRRSASKESSLWMACTRGFPKLVELLVRTRADAADHLAPRPLRPLDRHAPDVDAGEDGDREDADEGRSRPRRRVGPPRSLVTADREAVEVD